MSEIDLKTAMQAILANRRAGMDAPSPDELLSFREGILTDEEGERLLARAAAVPETARALLDARRFPDVEPADEDQRVSERDIDHQWQRFQDGLRQEEPASSHRPKQSQPTAFSPRQRWLPSLLDSLRFAQAAAAALLVVSLGLSWTLLTQRHLETDDIGPRLNLPIIELVPESEGGERIAGTTLQVPATADGVLLVLTLRDRRSFTAYEVEIQEPTGKVVWKSTALRRSSEGFFTMELPRDFLPADRYRITLRGVDGYQREPLAVYGLAIEGSKGAMTE